MGKIQAFSDLEVIPLDITSTKDSNTTKMNKSSIYMSDSSILPRVQKYLEANANNQFIDLNVMADDLQKKYSRDYGKRKKNAFRLIIKKAYSIAMQSYGMNNRNDSSSDDLSDESIAEENDVHFGDNPMNNQILEMYGRNVTSSKAIEDSELIDISSDDSNEPPELKSSNGPSTSHKLPMEGHFLDGLLPTPRLGLGLGLALLPTPAPPPKVSVIDVVSTPIINERGKKRKTEHKVQNNNTSNSSTPNPKKKKASVNTSVLEQPKVTFKDVGGMDKVLEDICKLLVHIKHPEVYRQIGISPPRGFLLHGPPGCGKTLLANAIAGELEVPLLKVSAPELVAGVSGESEERIRELFERATVSSPCILFIDEIDAITPNRQTAQKEMERRIVAQLLTCMDDLNKNEIGDQVLVIGATNRPDSLDPALRRSGRFDREVSLGIPDAASRMQILKVLTNKLKLDACFDFEYLAKYTPGFVGADLMALTREAGMAAVNRVFYDIKEKRELEEAVAVKKSVEETIVVTPVEEVVAVAVELEADKNEAEIVVDGDDEKPKTAEASPNDSFVVIDDDVKQPAKVEAQSNAINSTQIIEVVAKPIVIKLTALEELISWLHNQAPLNMEQLSNLFITMDDFGKALKCVQPSAKREGFATVPGVTWDDVGSLRDVREELQMAILAPVRHAEQFKSLGLDSATGVLLCGPPGCGKTLLAKAIANEAGINFISVKGPELLNMYVGESERAVRVCFQRARNSAPCVIFFDELDALCPKRSDSREGGATMRVVNQMLTEMDGIEGRKDVYLLAASNRPDIIDPAVLRPGRLDKIVYVGLPTSNDRVDILRTITKNGTKPMLSADVDLETIGKSEQCDGYTGADLAALVREAGVQALREVMIQGDLEKPVLVTTEHFTKAVAKIRPSVSEKDQLHYEKLKKIYSAKQPDVEEMEYS